MDVDAELRRISREFARDIEKIVRGPRGCLDEGDAEVEAVMRAVFDGMSRAAEDTALELAETLDVKPLEWEP